MLQVVMGNSRKWKFSAVEECFIEVQILCDGNPGFPHLFGSHPDITLMVDWALKTNHLSAIHRRAVSQSPAASSFNDTTINHVPVF